MQAPDAIGDAAGLHIVRIAEVLAATPHSVDFFGGIDRLEPDRERPREIGRHGRRSVLGAPLQIADAARRVADRRLFAFAPLDRREAIILDEFEEFLPALIAQRFADQRAERMDILAQPGVLGGKLNALTIHNARLLNMQDEIL